MRSRLLAAPALLLVLSALAGCSGSDSDGDTASDPAPTQASSDAGGETGTSCDYTDDGRGAAKDVEPPSATATETGQVAATMKTSVGDIGLSLDADRAPCTVHSFVSLAEQGYFDGTSCHRLTTAATGIQVLQCGDPTGTGSGGPGYSFPDELSGDETYPAGTLAMANAGPDTNGSQFFIVYGKTPLPASYTVFGTVDKAGLQAVEKVAEGGVDDANGPGDGHPKTPVDITSVTVAGS